MTFLVSACLLGVGCKYTGGSNLCPRILALAGRHTLVPVCPEQLGGLPTPRPPAERRQDRVVTHCGRDVTASYALGAREAVRLAKLLGAEAAILKARSPSCGCGAIYDGSFTHTLIPADGLAAAALKAAGLPVYTEENLPAWLGGENGEDFSE